MKHCSRDQLQLLGQRGKHPKTYYGLGKALGQNPVEIVQE